MSARKRILTTILILGLVLSVGTAWAGYRLVRVYVGPDENAAEIAAMDLDVVSVVNGSHVDVMVDDGDMHRISLKGFKTDMLIEDVESHMASILADGMGDYHTYSEATEEMQAVAERYPQIARIDSIGRTYQGRVIWAIKISDYPQIHDPTESDVMFVGLHHAREIVTPEICLYLMNHLVDNYGIDPRITRLVNEREIWIIPVQNPDGHVRVESGDYLWRKNRRPAPSGTCIGVDTNRNYGFMWGHDDVGSSGIPCSQTYRGTGPFSEGETRAIRDLVMSGKHDFTIALSYHSYGDLILYPWGYTLEPTPDAATFAALADSMAAFNGYRPGPSYSNIYPTNGDFDDWMYGDVVVSVGVGGKDPGPPVEKERILAFTFEVGGGFGPPDTMIPALVEQNLEPSLVAIEYADNPYRVWPPDTPIMDAPMPLANGAWELRWRTPDPMSQNPPVAFEVERAAGHSLQVDDMESGMMFWEGTGFVVSEEKTHGGRYSIHTGFKKDTRSSVTPVYPMSPTYKDSLTFSCLYGLVSGDYFFIEVSEDGGKSYRLLSGYMTGPDGEKKHSGGYLTGDSGGWARAAFPLDRYAGKEIVCRLRCMTGSVAPKEGIYLDDIGPIVTFRERTTVARDLPIGRYTPVPSTDEAYLFRARAVDADGHRSIWSSPVVIPASQAPIRRVLAAPNPFATVTKISFAPGNGLADAGMVPVSLRVFDAAGRLVRTLLQGEVPADRFHEKAWDRTNDNGDRVPSGLYFVVLTTGGLKSAEKVVLVGGP